MDHLIYEKKGSIAVLRLNRPETMNSFSVPMLKKWLASLEDAEADDAIRVVILTGEGKGFCTGGDIKSVAAGTGFSADDTDGAYWGPKGIHRKHALTKLIHKVPLFMETMSKPVIAAINGTAVGAGLDMALMCDIRVIAESAKLSAGYIKVGLVPGDGGAYFLPRIVGTAKALELMWTGDFVSSSEAKALGLVNHVIPDEELDKFVWELATKIAQNPPVCVQMVKRAVYQGLQSNLKMSLDLISSHMALVSEMDDHAEGVRAIMEKRNPVFTGK